MTHARSDATKAEWIGLLSACPVVPGATVSKPLFSAPEGKVVLFAMDAGQEISEHKAPFAASVHVLDGRLRFAVGADEREMGPHDWLVMPPDAPHRLRALDPSRFVLTLFKGAQPGR
ncbi:MAG: cupin domain-containing protein [Phycisphaerae bacterium]|nr:cupin domain-containing protein [Phycisphaerae bacterium]